MEPVADASGPPFDLGIVDLMVGVPSRREGWVQDFPHLVRDADSPRLRHAAGYLFHDLPEVPEADDTDFVAWLITQMDRWGIEHALLPVADGDRWGRQALRSHPDRLHGFTLVDPTRPVEACRTLRHAVVDLGAVAAALFPAGTSPQVAPSDPLAYPVLATCVELGVPLFVNVGVPGPRFPMSVQHVEHLDAVCRDFPDLRVVMRHGAEPWEDLAVALMRRWPNLYYSTSAFAPKHYPSAIVEYANTDGADRVAYAGYFPSGLSLDRIMTELPDVGFADHVWPRFLRENGLGLLTPRPA